MALHSYESVSELISPNNSRSLYIVDDETELLSTLGESLIELGFEPQAFNRPDELLDAITPDDIGCVITDLRMPGIGGMELIKRLNDRDSCLSTILMTAFADVPTAVDVMKLGAVSVLEKPFELNVLIREINAAFETSEQNYSKRKKLREAVNLLNDLSADEIAVLDLAIEGTTNREIAERLSISPRTVDRRRHSGLQKLNADSVSDYAVLKTLATS